MLLLRPVHDPDDNDLRGLVAGSSRATLECVECGQAAHDACAGWKAYVADGYEFPASEVLVYCPGCAEREFGDAA